MNAIITWHKAAAITNRSFHYRSNFYVAKINVSDWHRNPRRPARWRLAVAGKIFILFYVRLLPSC